MWYKREAVAVPAVPTTAVPTTAVVGITVVGTAVVGTAAASRDKHKHYKSSDVLMYFSGQTFI